MGCFKIIPGGTLLHTAHTLDLILGGDPSQEPDPQTSVDVEQTLNQLQGMGHGEGLVIHLAPKPGPAPSTPQEVQSQESTAAMESGTRVETGTVKSLLPYFSNYRYTFLSTQNQLWTNFWIRITSMHQTADSIRPCFCSATTLTSLASGLPKLRICPTPCRVLPETLASHK
jgi:hypothetical protein